MQCPSLVLAGACLDQGLCDVRWNAIGVPWRGTPVADLAYVPESETVPQPLSEASRSMSPHYRNLSSSSALVDLVRNRRLVLRNLCGSSPYGTGGDAALQLSSFASLVAGARPWKQATDGLVPLATA